MELKAGSQTPVTACILRVHLATDAWGQLWRAQHPSYGSVLLLLYTTSEARPLFAECLPHWNRWRDLATTGACPELLRIYEIVPAGELPHLVVEDPGGLTIRQMAGPQGVLGVKAAAAVAAGVAAALVHSSVYDIPLVNVCPDTAISSDLQGSKWKILPIAPNAIEGGSLLWNGRYLPPDVRPGADLGTLKPDVYGVSYLLVDMIAGLGKARPEPASLKDFVPYTRLRTVVGNGLLPRGGSFGDPKLTQLGLERWLKHHAEEDIEEVRKAQQAALGKAPHPALQYYLDNKKRIHQAAIVLGVVIVFVAGLTILPSLFRTRNTEKTPYGLTNLFFEALVDRDAGKALGYTTGEAQSAVQPLLVEIERMESRNQASRFARGIPRVAGDGDARTVKVDLKGVSGDLFMTAEMTIRRQEDGNWRVESLFYKPAS